MIGKYEISYIAASGTATEGPCSAAKAGPAALTGAVIEAVEIVVESIPGLWKAILRYYLEIELQLYAHQWTEVFRFYNLFFIFLFLQTLKQLLQRKINRSHLINYIRTCYFPDVARQ